MRAALDVLAHLPADNKGNDKFADVGGRGGGRGTGGKMIINPRFISAICQGRSLRRGRK
jgi:hypothetical protein